MYYEVVQVGMVTFTAFSCGVMVGTFVTAYKENRSPIGGVDTKRRLYTLALALLSTLVVTGISINSLMRFINSHSH